MTEERRNQLLVAMHNFADIAAVYHAERERLKSKGVQMCDEFFDLLPTGKYTSGMQVYEGIEELAEAAGQKLDVTEFDGVIYQRFTAFDVSFFQVGIQEVKKNE